LPIIPLAVIQLTMRSRWPGIYNLYNDWANIAYYSVYLVAGFLLACHPTLERLVQREWKRSLVIGLGATAVLLLAVLGIGASPAVLLVGSAVAGWCFVVALVGLAHQFLATSGPALHYLSESAFPVYVLHQAAIVLPGYFLIRLPLGIGAKFVLLLLLSVSLTLAAYHWLVRPFAVPRFLLGMKPKVCPVRRPVALSASAAAILLAVVGLSLPARSAAATPVGLWYAEAGLSASARGLRGAHRGYRIRHRHPTKLHRRRERPHHRLRGEHRRGVRDLPPRSAHRPPRSAAVNPAMRRPDFIARQSRCPT